MLSGTIWHNDLLDIIAKVFPSQKSTVAIPAVKKMNHGFNTNTTIAIVKPW